MRPVLIIHGWDANNGGVPLWDEIYGGLRGELEARGVEVHRVAGLPGYRTGNSAGDAAVNASVIASRIAALGLTDLVVAGHSYGGMVLEYLVRLYPNLPIYRYVTLDSAVHEWPGAKWPFTKLGPWLLNPPDQWAGSVVRNTIFASPARVDLAPVNVWASELYRANWMHFTNARSGSPDHIGVLNDQVTVDTLAGFAMSTTLL